MTEFTLVRLDDKFRSQYALPDGYIPVGMPMAASIPPDALLRTVRRTRQSGRVGKPMNPCGHA